MPTKFHPLITGEEDAERNRQADRRWVIPSIAALVVVTIIVAALCSAALSIIQR